MKIPDILQYKIPHHKWKLIYAELYAILSIAKPGEVVSIVGPSRVGKSKVVAETLKHVAANNNFEETGRLPTLYVEATNTGPHGTFSSKDFTERMLSAISHPMLAFNDTSLKQLNNKLDRTTESRLRRALESGIVARGVKYLIIDEAQHVRYTTKGAQGSYAVMDSWKCLAQETDVVLVLVGAYPILDIIKNSPHMLGRKHQIHFPRYHETPNELKEFANIVFTILDALDLEMDLNLAMKKLNFFYNGSFGCVGLLNAWLRRAYAISNAYNSAISWDILKRTKLPEAELVEIRKEIIFGEKLLGYKPSDDPTPNPSFNPGSDQKIRTARQRKNKPFQRKPMRMKQGERS